MQDIVRHETVLSDKNVLDSSTSGDDVNKSVIKVGIVTSPHNNKRMDVKLSNQKKLKVIPNENSRKSMRFMQNDVTNSIDFLCVKNVVIRSLNFETNILGLISERYEVLEKESIKHYLEENVTTATGIGLCFPEFTSDKFIEDMKTFNINVVRGDWFLLSDVDNDVARYLVILNRIIDMITQMRYDSNNVWWKQYTQANLLPANMYLNGDNVDWEFLLILLQVIVYTRHLLSSLIFMIQKMF